MLNRMKTAFLGAMKKDWLLMVAAVIVGLLLYGPFMYLTWPQATTTNQQQSWSELAAIQKGQANQETSDRVAKSIYGIESSARNLESIFGTWSASDMMKSAAK